MHAGSARELDWRNRNLEMQTAIDTKVLEGLRQHPKRIPSWYFYDARGGELFQQIMAMPEYYLTRAEHEILRGQAESIFTAAGHTPGTPFAIIELGAGDGSKTKELLRYLIANDFNFIYQPVDISSNAIDLLKENLSDLPEFEMEPLVGDYFEMLQQTMSNDVPKMVLFLGSNLGNYDDATAKQFLQRAANGMQSGDVLLMGLDIVKDPKRILDAYNDAAGITKAFNMNLLERMNRELDADFDKDRFDHAPVYENNQAVSYIISKEDQSVYFGATEERIEFKKGEKIQTEISRKYTRESLQGLLGDSFQITHVFQDRQKDFSDFLLIKS